MSSLASFFGIAPSPTITGPLLLHGDCLQKMKNLPSKSIDCFLCDLPYGCLSSSTNTERFRYYDGVRTDSILNTKLAGCSWDVKIDLPQFWEQVKRLAKNDHTPVIMFCSTRFGAELIMSNPSWFRHDLVWSKSRGVGFLSANKQPLRSHEMMYVFAKKGAFYKRVDIKGDFKQYSGGEKQLSHMYSNRPIKHISSGEGIRCVKSVVEISNKKGKGNHPTQKPAELYKWLLERYCPPGGTMLDPTAGSFASVFTAREMGIHAIGIEMDDGFFWKAVQRSYNEFL
jgi:site-specific DNA-methyltransferase (adenine-specific)